MSYKAQKIWLFDPAIPTQQIREAIEYFWKNWLPLHNRNEDLKLFHYTTFEGFKGIIKNRSIWLSHINSLNDPNELKYGKQLILNILNRQIGNKHSELINQYLSYLATIVNGFSESIYGNYVACFCESNNLLSQWRAYGHRGGGYNLGFTFTSDTKFYISENHSEKGDNLILRKIIYDPTNQNKIITDYVTSIISSIKAATKKKIQDKHDGDLRSRMAAWESLNILYDLMLSFKNPVFEEEKEWRLILSRQPDDKVEQLHFRENDSTHIPYFDTNIFEIINDTPVFPIHSIRFGPMLDVASTRSAISLFIRKEATLENPIKIDADAIVITDAGYVLK